MKPNPQNKKPAGRAGSLQNGCGTGNSHLTKVVEWMVLAPGIPPRIVRDRALAYRLAFQLRREGHEAELRPIERPLQLELQF